MNDPILYWNEVALQANLESHTNGENEQTGPTLSSRALGIVHLAMYDAFAGASGNPAGLPPYLPGLMPPPPPVSPEAAVAAAAHATLSALFPSQKTFFDVKHQLAGLTGPGLATGRDFGLLVAQRLLDDRKDDPKADDKGYAPSMAPGRHRVDPDNPDQGYHAPFYGAKSKLFAASMRHALDEPPPLGPGSYEQALQEVRAKGIKPELMGTVVSAVTPRTVNETLIGVYWGYDGAAGLGTPPRLYNQIIRWVAMKTPNPANGGKVNTPAQNARLFALVNVAMADAGILAWEQKYHWDFWRPVVGIREHDRSMGPAGEPGYKIADDCQPDWLPLGAPATNALFRRLSEPQPAYPYGHVLIGAAKNFTPPFPAYPSGHATFGAAAFHITRRFYGIGADDRSKDKLFDNLAFVSDEHNGINKDNNGTIRPKHTRKFTGGLWQMIEENGRSRVYLGVHWVFDAFAVDKDGNPDYQQNVGGVPLGVTIANDIFDKKMTKPAPLPKA